MLTASLLLASPLADLDAKRDAIVGSRRLNLSQSRAIFPAKVRDLNQGAKSILRLRSCDCC